MLRRDLNILHDYRRAAENAMTMGAKLRGRLTWDSVGAASQFASTRLMGTIYGIPIYRDSGLANDKFVYSDSAGNVIESN